MVSIGDYLSSDQAAAIAQSTVSAGDVYLIDLGQENGIHPKEGYDTRRKFFVVLGFDGNVMYGGIVINSEINTNIRGQIVSQHLLLDHNKYPFLSHDSYADCLKLKIVDVATFRTWKYKGVMKVDDLETIRQKIVDSPQETRVNLKKYGLIK